MQIDLSGQTALVTGGARGIGRACAEVLSQAGARVIVLDIDLSRATDVARGLADGVAIGCDLASVNEVAEACERIEEEFGGVQVLVNNAGLVLYRSGIASVSAEEWDRTMAVNLRGMFLVCQGLLPGMKARRYGRIVNLSSMSARQGAMDSSIDYASSKGGVIAFTRTLAKEAGPYGITVNALAPGIIGTEPVLRKYEGEEKRLRGMIPLRRLGTPADVAGAVLFFASELSSYVTGVVLDVNGGLFIG